MVFHRAELPLHGPQRKRAPPPLLIVRAPPRYPRGLRLRSRHLTFDQVRRLEAHPELREHIEPVPRQRLLEPLREMGGRRFVHEPQLAMQSLERALGIGVRGVSVRRLEFAVPRRLVLLCQAAQHVLALVPLAALHRHVVAEYVSDGRAQPLRPIEHDEHDEHYEHD